MGIWELKQFGLASRKESATSGRLVNVSISTISENPDQPRKKFFEEDLQELAESIKHNGIIQPLIVRKLPGTDMKYELVAGERRLKAAKLAGEIQVPCVVIETNRQQSAILALMENMQRKDLNFFEEAQGIAKLISVYKLSQEEVAAYLGKAQSTVSNKLRLLKYSEREVEQFLNAGLTERHARALLKLSTEELRELAISKVISGNLTVQETEALVESLIIGEKEKASFEKRKVVLRDVRLYINTIKKTVENMNEVGIAAGIEKREGIGCIEYVVRIPLEESAKGK